MKSKNEEELEKRLRQMIQHIAKLKKKARDNNLWLGCGFDALREPTDEDQQGPLVNRLFELVEENKKYLKGNK